MLKIALLSCSLFFVACAHRVAIHSTEPGAYVHVDGLPLGQAPVILEETTGMGREYVMAVTKEGHKPFYLPVTQSSVNFTVHTAGLLSPFPVGLATVGLIIAGANPYLVGIAATATILYVNLTKFQLADQYVVPVGEPGEEALSEEFLNRGADNRKVQANPNELPEVKEKPCGAFICP